MIFGRPTAIGFSINRIAWRCDLRISARLGDVPRGKGSQEFLDVGDDPAIGRVQEKDYLAQVGGEETYQAAAPLTSPLWPLHRVGGNDAQIAQGVREALDVARHPVLAVEDLPVGERITDPVGHPDDHRTGTRRLGPHKGHWRQ